MNYNESVKYLNRYQHLVPERMYINTKNGLVERDTIRPLLISPLSEIGNMVKQMIDNGADNFKALIDLDLINQDLRVYAIAMVDATEIIWTDLQWYIDKHLAERLN